MFGALNRFISRLDVDSQSQKSAVSGAYGFQVLRNKNPELAIDPWFDFIVGINGRTIDNAEPSLFATEVRNCAGSTISLGVYGAKAQQIRELFVPISAEAPSLGLALQWSPLSTTDDVWHILDVAPNSPADLSGLLPYSDYVIGSPEGLMHGERGFGELVEEFTNRPLRLFVYNNEYDVTRIVTITPSRAWGGDGALGCVLGFGALHRVPPPLTEPAQAPGETLFETARFSNEESRSVPILAPGIGLEAPVSPAPPRASAEYLIPANMQLDATSPPTGPPSAGAGGPPKAARKARAHHNISPSVAMDDYFKEGEQKSREVDNAPTPKPGSALPPPPRAGAGAGAGPPRANTLPAPPMLGDEDQGEA